MNITLTLPDGSKREYSSGSTGLQVAVCVGLQNGGNHDGLA
ncbi:MAG: hypothetical protein ACOVSW_19030 [Candidatus Kapaibacteriota bacterium]